MRLVLLVAPHAGDIPRHTAYARECVLDCLDKQEAPLLPQLLYTVASPDSVNPAAINAGRSWGIVADAYVVYTDFGISEAMANDLATAMHAGLPIEYRNLRPVLQ